MYKRGLGWGLGRCGEGDASRGNPTTNTHLYGGVGDSHNVGVTVRHMTRVVIPNNRCSANVPRLVDYHPQPTCKGSVELSVFVVLWGLVYVV